MLLSSLGRKRSLQLVQKIRFGFAFRFLSGRDNYIPFLNLKTPEPPIQPSQQVSSADISGSKKKRKKRYEVLPNSINRRVGERYEKVRTDVLYSVLDDMMLQPPIPYDEITSLPALLNFLKTAPELSPPITLDKVIVQELLSKLLPSDMITLPHNDLIQLIQYFNKYELSYKKTQWMKEFIELIISSYNRSITSNEIPNIMEVLTSLGSLGYGWKGTSNDEKQRLLALVYHLKDTKLITSSFTHYSSYFAMLGSLRIPWRQMIEEDDIHETPTSSTLLASLMSFEGKEMKLEDLQRLVTAFSQLLIAQNDHLPKHVTSFYNTLLMTSLKQSYPNQHVTNKTGSTPSYQLLYSIVTQLAVTKPTSVGTMTSEEIQAMMNALSLNWKWMMIYWQCITLESLGELGFHYRHHFYPDVWKAMLSNLNQKMSMTSFQELSRVFDALVGLGYHWEVMSEEFKGGIERVIRLNCRRQSNIDAMMSSPDHFLQFLEALERLGVTHATLSEGIRVKLRQVVEQSLPKWKKRSDVIKLLQSYASLQMSSSNIPLSLRKIILQRYLDLSQELLSPPLVTTSPTTTTTTSTSPIATVGVDLVELGEGLVDMMSSLKGLKFDLKEHADVRTSLIDQIQLVLRQLPQVLSQDSDREHLLPQLLTSAKDLGFHWQMMSSSLRTGLRKGIEAYVRSENMIDVSLLLSGMIDLNLSWQYLQTELRHAILGNVIAQIKSSTFHTTSFTTVIRQLEQLQVGWSDLSRETRKEMLLFLRQHLSVFSKQDLASLFRSLAVMCYDVSVEGTKDPIFNQVHQTLLRHLLAVEPPHLTLLTIEEERSIALYLEWWKTLPTSFTHSLLSEEEVQRLPQMMSEPSSQQKTVSSSSSKEKAPRNIYRLIADIDERVLRHNETATAEADKLHVMSRLWYIGFEGKIKPMPIYITDVTTNEVLLFLLLVDNHFIPSNKPVLGREAQLIERLYQAQYPKVPIMRVIGEEKNRENRLQVVEDVFKKIFEIVKGRGETKNEKEREVEGVQERDDVEKQ